MSDCCVNIRILFWHLQITTSKRFRFSFNEWLWENERKEAIMLPIRFIEFSPSKYGTTSESVGLGG